MECAEAEYYLESQDAFEACETLCASDLECTSFAWTGSGECHACRLSRATCLSTEPTSCNSTTQVYSFQKVPLKPVCKPITPIIIEEGTTSLYEEACDTTIEVWFSVGTSIGFEVGDT